MDLKSALKEQFHASMAMLGQCIQRCPDDLWTAGASCRETWRIAQHVLFYTDLYLRQGENDWAPWTEAPEGLRRMWAARQEPYELPASTPAMSQTETLAYLTYIDGMIDQVIDGLDLDTGASGFPWYPNISKLSHELMTLRHLEGHVGQISELLLARDIELDWVAKATSWQTYASE